MYVTDLLGIKTEHTYNYTTQYTLHCISSVFLPTHIDIVLPAELLKLKRVVALMAINPTP